MDHFNIIIHSGLQMQGTTDIGRAQHVGFLTIDLCECQISNLPGHLALRQHVTASRTATGRLCGEGLQAQLRDVREQGLTGIGLAQHIAQTAWGVNGQPFFQRREAQPGQLLCGQDQF